MFIEKLWEENPDLVIKAVKNVWGVREDLRDSVEFEKIKDNVLTFIKDGRAREHIHVSDFWISSVSLVPYRASNERALKWVKFMHKVYGNKYALQYISYRNQQLDKYMAEYEENYNKETRTVLNEMGFDYGKTK